MDALQIFALFFGIPLAILGLGLRHAIGTRRMLALLLLSSAVGLYGLLVESVLRMFGVDLPAPTHASWGSARVFLPFCVASAILGAFGVVLVRFRARSPR